MLGAKPASSDVMRPERVVIGLTLLLMLSGWGTCVVGGNQALRSTGIWLFLAAAAVLAVPLAFAIAYALWENLRRVVRRRR
jgi:ABC-type spermidine/putrescine transport system permease subunit II